MLVEVDPALSGYWGDETVSTISHQSVLMGIPAVQLEMPLRLREKLCFDDELVAMFAGTVATAYREVVVPWWEASGGPENVKLGRQRIMLDASLPAKQGVVAHEVPDGGFRAWCESIVQGLLHIDRSTNEVQI